MRNWIAPLVTATLTLNNVQSASAGDCTVTVSNGAGSVTSGPATLTVSAPQAPPTLSVERIAGGQIRLSWPASASGFVFETNGNLSITGWTAVPANQVTTEGTNQVFAEQPAAQARFYGLRRS
ncbi:MAG: hypothetical protein FJ403_15285 [Verrucomicrobia bacterium]|nr:hypothetical protein [Verrucomicrobiota bacterium]